VEQRGRRESAQVGAGRHPHRCRSLRDPGRGQRRNCAASQRAVDPERSTYDASGTLIRPFHPFTRASQEPVRPNDPALYQIELYPTSAIFRKGDRIRLTIGSADTPATAPPIAALANSLGGEIRMPGAGRYASHVLLPVEPD
jgi:uncharacterized protein